MENKEKIIASNCNFSDVRPITMALPYPQIRVAERNAEYAEILCGDYAGDVSELSAITQYINNENRLACEQCALAKTLLGIAMAEMLHLQMLGEMICLLGGNIDFTAKARNGQSRMWTPQYLNLPTNAKEMLGADIRAEKNAINQYRIHSRMINDRYVNAVLARIIQDEEYHIMILRNLLKDA